MRALLNQYGSAGFEVVGISGADKTVGFNSIFVVLKRSQPTQMPPPDTTPGWKPDPFQRFAFRWWSGLNWEESVMKAGSSEIIHDWPMA